MSSIALHDANFQELQQLISTRLNRPGMRPLDHPEQAWGLLGTHIRRLEDTGVAWEAENTLGKCINSSTPALAMVLAALHQEFPNGTADLP